MSNITFFLEDENTLPDNNFNIDEILSGIENDVDLESESDLDFPKMINYTENYTVKELLLICEYYDLKVKKCTKDIIVQFIVDFESKSVNREIVCKRKNMWFYMNELKNDKCMKKYIFHF